MKLVFLDFDGVMNDYAWLGGPWCASRLDPKLVVRLNAIVERTGAKVVVSSSWRHGTEVDALRAILVQAGFRGEVIDKTPVLAHWFNGVPWLVRGHEIQAWLGCCADPVESFVILDDDADMAMLLPWLVRTFCEAGMQDAEVEAAVAVLGALEHEAEARP
jgi:hypothetical protein